MDIGMDQVLNAEEVIKNFEETFVSIYRIKKYITNITNITLFWLVMVNWALVFLIQGVARVIVILVHACINNTIEIVAYQWRQEI